MRRIAIGPADRLRDFVEVPDVATDLTSEVGDGRKDATCQEVPLNLGKPELDLIQPRRVGGREMHLHVRKTQSNRCWAGANEAAALEALAGDLADHQRLKGLSLRLLVAPQLYWNARK